MFKKLKHAVLLLALAMAISGCAEAILVGVGAAGGAGAALWAKGKMVEEINVSLSKAHTASLAALKSSPNSQTGNTFRSIFVRLRNRQARSR